MSEAIFYSVYVFIALRAKYLNGGGSGCPMERCSSQAGL